MASILLLASKTVLAHDPFEDFSKYGEINHDVWESTKPEKLFYGDTELGLIFTTGNTNSSSAKIKANLYQDFSLWRNQLKFDSLVKRDKFDGEEQALSAARVFTSLQSNYNVGKKNASLFIYTDYEYDRFNGLEHQASFVSGYGNRFYEGSRSKVDFDIGPGINYQRTETGDSNVGYLLRVAVQWEQRISKRARFNQNLSIEQSISGLNSRFKSETALVSEISGDLSLKFSYLYRYNSKPEPGKAHYDGETSATFVYQF